MGGIKFLKNFSKKVQHLGCAAFFKKKAGKKKQEKKSS
jgi:hypothetical protein